MTTLPFTTLVMRALDAGGHAPNSPAAIYAIEHAGYVGQVVHGAAGYAMHYRFRTVPRTIDRVDAALNLAILAIAETSRGVRVLT